MGKDINAYCYKVKGLMVPYDTPSNINRNINNYIDRIGTVTQRLEDSFNKRDVSEYIRSLEAIQDMLQSVYALRCESYTKSLLCSAKEYSIEYSEKVVQQAIADFLLLAIEMQKAQNAGAGATGFYKDIEKNEEIAQIMSAISRLIAAGEYEKARSLVSDAKGKDSSFEKLGKLLDSQDYKKAKETASSLENDIIARITNSDSRAKTHKVILSVDDRPEILTNVSNALRSHYRVLGAPSGRVALDIMSQNKIDLFFLDIDMPEMDGFEVARAIRSDKNYTNTPLLFLTSNASREHITRAINLGCNDFIVKPAYNVVLLIKARKFLD